MNNALEEYEKRISRLSEEEKIKRNLYLKRISSDEFYGPMTGYPSIDKPWLKYYSDEAISAPLPNVSAYELMKMNNKDNLGKCALDYYGRKISYYELLENIEKVAKSLKAHGINEGDIVSICMPNMPETIYVFYALNKIGAVANMIDLRTNAENIKEYINKNDSKILITLDGIEAKIESIKDDIVCSNVISVSPAESLPTIKKELYKLKNKTKDSAFTSWDEFISMGKSRESAETIDNRKDKPAVIIYTGGTTGNPKGAILSNDALTSMYVQQQYANPKMEKNDTLLGIMPPFIAYGVVYGINGPLTTGMEVILIPKFNISDFPHLVVEHKPNHVIGVPSMWEELAFNYENTNVDLSFLKSAIAGGAPISTDAYERISLFLKNHSMNDNLRIGYGQTEASSSTTFMVDPKNFEPSTVGIPLVKTTIRIVKPGTDEEVGYNEEGEVVLSGPTIMNGYIDADKNSEVINIVNGEKRLHSKDIGYIDENGMLYLSGRSKDIIFRPDGHNVFPLKIEKVLSTHKAIKDILVVGASCEETKNGFIPVAYVTLHDEYKDKADEVLKELEELNKAKLPERDGVLKFYIIDEMPLTNIGKPDRNKIEETSRKLKLPRNLIY